jgi:hypothetical protein
VGFGATAGLLALGDSSVYREGFEVVLFLRNLRLQDGTGVVLEGIATAIVGVLTFYLHAKLPYKRMPIHTGGRGQSATARRATAPPATATERSPATPRSYEAGFERGNEPWPSVSPSRALIATARTARCS